MAVQFPANPSEGDEFASGDFQFIFDGDKWVSAGLNDIVDAIEGATGPKGDSITGATGPDGIYNFVASGTISNGSTVVINTDGTVSVVAATNSGPIAGSASVFDPSGPGASRSSSSIMSAVYDSANQKVVIAYQDTENFNNYGNAVVGTVSGTSITFGTEVVFHAADSAWISAAYDSANQKVVIVYQKVDFPGQLRAIVGTVSGTSITFGSSALVLDASNTSFIACTYDSANQKVVIVYRDFSNGDRGTAIVGTVSGTSITFGSSAVFNSQNSAYMAITYDSVNQKVVIAYNDVSNSQYGTAVVGTVSGTSITFGSSAVFNSARTRDCSCTFDSGNQKVVIAYKNDSSRTDAVVGTVSGNSISFGSVVSVTSGQSSYATCTYDSSIGQVVIGYRDNSNQSYGTAVFGTVSGTNITFGPAIIFAAGNSEFITSTYDSTNDKVVFAYTASSTTNKEGTSTVLSSGDITTNVTDENYIGIAAEAISDGSTGEINVLGGINSGQSGLIAGRTYYIQLDGSLETTPADPAVVAGTSVGTTKIIVKG